MHLCLSEEAVDTLTMIIWPKVMIITFVLEFHQTDSQVSSIINNFSYGKINVNKCKNISSILKITFIDT